MIKQLHFSDHDFYACLDSVLKRGRDHDDQIDDIVRAIIARVRTEGDAAVIELTRKFDGGQLDAGSMELTRPQRMRYADQVVPELVNALTAATLRIRNFHKKEQLQSWNYTELDGTLLGQKISPLDRVGVYVPGGKAAYPSSVLMTVIPARVAGVKEIIMVVPTPGGEINPAVIAAAEIAGVDRIFTIGGAQAIAALAYGTASVPAVDKIVGPGNAYVAAAKKMVFGKVGIDMIAGPSEVVVIADSSANPEWVAMDLFAQAEHDERAQAIAIVTSPMVGEAIVRSAKNLLPHMERRHIIEKSLLDNGAVIYVDNLDQAVEVSDYIAPEHLELIVSAPEILAEKINHAGAIFIGKYSAEALADYCAGPNHVLPTSGTARFSSPLGVYDFQKRSSIMMASRQGAEKMSHIATVLASCEGLTAHEQAARYRGLEAAGHSRQISTKQETELLINSIVPEQILGMRAYKTPDSRKLIKLDAMENPYSLPEAIHQEWLQALASVPINRYPDSRCRKLKKRLSGYIGMPDRCRLVLGNGSDEIIQMLVLMLGGKGRVIMAPAPSFSMYRQICLTTSTDFVGVPLQSDFSLDANAMLKAIELYQPSCIFLSYPNNPTGNTFDPETIRSIIKRAPGLVVIDEAYYAFCGKSFLHEVPDYSNVVLLRTMSKSGLAGLRLGYAVASRQWCVQIEKLRPPYNINVLTQASAEFILAHASILETQAAAIIKNRDTLFYDLNSISGLEVFHSETNFHLIRVAVNADQVFLDLKSMGVLVKNLHGSEPMLENCLRVAVGTPEENDRFLLSITKALAKSS